MNKPPTGEVRPTMARRAYPTILVRTTVVADSPLPTFAACTNTEAAERVLRALYGTLHADRETFSALFLDARNRPIGWHVVSTGILTASLVHPREVYAPALSVRAVSVVLCHNHPSGDAEPSPEDFEITNRLTACGDLLGVRVADHLILNMNGGGTPYVSFLQRGFLNRARVDE